MPELNIDKIINKKGKIKGKNEKIRKEYKRPKIKRKSIS